MKQSIDLREFNMASIKDPSTLLWIGKRKTGKSFCVRDFLWYHQDVPVVTAISGSEESNSFYGDLIPKSLTFPDYTSDIVQRVLDRQQKVIEKKREPKYAKLDERMIFIMDDLMHNVKEWIKDPNIRYISMNGRHKRMFWILTMQYVLGIPPAFRTNIDYVFIMRENLVQNRRRLYEAFCGMFPTYDVFSQVMDKVTENYGCLVVANNARSNNLLDQVFWYRAREHPPFRLCAPVLWRHQEHVQAPMQFGRTKSSFTVQCLKTEEKQEKKEAEPPIQVQSQIVSHMRPFPISQHKKALQASELTRLSA